MINNLWMPNVEHIPTAAFGGYGVIKPVGAINHIMQGYQTTMINWAKERPYKTLKSAHFTINREGRIVQHVALNQASWASGSVRDPTWRLLKSNSRGPLNPNGYIINIEHEGFSKPPGYGYDYIYNSSNPWPEKMVLASIEVHRWIFDELGLQPNEDTITGHYAIDSITRAHDPGQMWPQKRVIDAVNTGGLPPPVNKSLAYWEIFAGRVTPIRIEGKQGVYEIKVKI